MSLPAWIYRHSFFSAGISAIPTQIFNVLPWDGEWVRVRLQFNFTLSLVVYIHTGAISCHLSVCIDRTPFTQAGISQTPVQHWIRILHSECQFILYDYNSCLNSYIFWSVLLEYEKWKAVLLINEKWLIYI